MTLKSAIPGRMYTADAVSCDKSAKMRLASVGIVPGSAIFLLRRSRGGTAEVYRPVVAHCDRRTPRLRRIPSPSIPSVRRTVRLRIMPRHAPRARREREQDCASPPKEVE